MLTWQGAEAPVGDEPTRAVSVHELNTLQGVNRPGPWEDELTRAAPGPSPDVPWFILVKGVQQGPLSVPELLGRIHRQEITPKTYVWRHGLREWLRASDIPELIPLLATPLPAAPLTQNVPPALPPRSPRREVAEQAEPEPVNQAEVEDLFADLSWPSAQPAKAPSGQLPWGTVPEMPALPPTARERVRGPESKRPTREGSAAEPVDPFAGLEAGPDAEPPPPHESTGSLIAQARGSRRRSVWRMVAVVGVLAALVIGALFLLSRLNGVRLEVTKVEPSGETVKRSVFTPAGVSGLKDLLLGRTQAPAPLPAEKSRPPSRPAPAPRAPAPRADPPGPEAEVSPELRKLYEEEARTDVGPPAAKPPTPPPPPEESGGEGPDADEVKRVVEQTQPAFQFCIEQHMRKNPRFRGGKVNLVATVGASGVVKKTSLDRADLDASDLGTCLKGKARRMVFSEFQGEDVDLQIPLILTTTL